MRNFRDYTTWQDGIKLTATIYKLCEKFPKHEIFGLTSQIERAVVSIPSNIAEGSGRETEMEFARFLDYSLGSAYEVETQIEIAHNLNYVNDEEYAEVIECVQSIQRRLTSFIIKISHSQKP